MKNRLAETRERRGWSQNELAANADVSASAISRIERGRSLGSAEILVKLADALDVSVDELLGRTPGNGKARAASPAKKKRGTGLSSQKG